MKICSTSIRTRQWLAGGLIALGLVAVGCEPPIPIDGNGPGSGAGQPGPQGPVGESGILTTVGFAGPIASLLPLSGLYVWAGPTALVTTDDTHTTVSATASASMGLNTGAPQFADLGICWQPALGGPLGNFLGSDFATSYFTVQRADHMVAATRTFAVGDFKVGMCVRNNGASPINNNNIVSGWVTVSS